MLEIRSGPARDADYLESLRVAVRRTDAARSVAEIQSERGKKVDIVDVVEHHLGGPYAAVAALRVLMHVGRDRIDGVLLKIAAALAPGRGFLVSAHEGIGETPLPRWRSVTRRLRRTPDHSRPGARMGRP